MRISRLRTAWIIFLSGFYTAYACSRAIIKSLFGKPSRAWVDQVIDQWINRLLNLIGVKSKVFNPHNVEPQPGEATIIMCNHSSLYDIPISYKTFPDHSIRMLAKKELSNILLLGRAMKIAEFPFVDRKNRHQAIKDLAYMKKLMESGIVMWIAPEGTRSKDGKVAKFKKGGFITAIEAKATIIPIGIRGAFDILPARTYRFNINRTAEIHIGKPINTSEYSMENKEKLISKVHKEIRTLAGEKKNSSEE
ncbi:1-acyl-sn-glycerol-3-phosphate acyltransferase [Legionella israelensis]|uniref:1-acyl-sn-glycerol-3-phosphate acyltransferase n=1 Tax=Legionella israelensis TaxID=454 RepID=A0AAX1EJY2_9GAMM|nr:lysophospholipid acyltransferase family protein [Legionella israelensis]QBR85413.1 1-acyl-sn-glycerol-3-phosphate acyltransferase [Legionella israelensis]